MTAASRLRLLSRPGCHLCDDMARSLAELHVPFETVDVEQDAGLRQSYGESIPVLMRDDLEVARAPQSTRTLERALRRAGVL